MPLSLSHSCAGITQNPLLQTESCVLLTGNPFIFSQASLKKFMSYVQGGMLEKMAKLLDKGLDPNYHDSDNGGKEKNIYKQTAET